MSPETWYEMGDHIATTAIVCLVVACAAKELNYERASLFFLGMFALPIGTYMDIQIFWYGVDLRESGILGIWIVALALCITAAGIQLLFFACSPKLALKFFGYN